jgi:glycosyltransferase involved in cell wall biosynthesis
LPTLRILTIASLDWRNGHEYALQATQILKKCDVDFEYRIVGDGDFLEAVAFARHDLDLEDIVHLILRASREEICQLFEWSNVFILAAVKASASHALANAINNGKPAIISDLPEWVTNYGEIPGIYIVPRRDPSALAKKLAELIK